LTIAGSYREWLDTVLDAVAGLSDADVEAVLHGNARAFYRPRPQLQPQSFDPAAEEASG
jgi:predicted TIM-barrel fold metal-dependent hydrolase